MHNNPQRVEKETCCTVETSGRPSLRRSLECSFGERGHIMLLFKEVLTALSSLQHDNDLFFVAQNHSHLKKSQQLNSGQF